MSSCFSRCLRVPIAMRTFYEPSLWILQHFLPTHPDLHHGLIGILPLAFTKPGKRSLSMTPQKYLRSRLSLEPRSHRLYIPGAAQVFPLWIALLDERNLLVPFPALQLFLASESPSQLDYRFRNTIAEKRHIWR